MTHANTLVTQCRSCHAKIMFVRHEGGKLMCLNAAPDPERGNVMVVIDEGGAEVCRVRGKLFAEASRRAGATMYLSHHATCPQAGQFERSAAVAR